MGAGSLPLVHRLLADFLLTVSFLLAAHLFISAVHAVEIVELVQTILD